MKIGESLNLKFLNYKREKMTKKVYKMLMNH